MTITDKNTTEDTPVSERKWTKDWTYSAKLSGSENHKGFYIGIKGVGVLADVMPIDEDGIEGEKIARLIASAPYLRDSLQEAVKLLSQCWSDDVPTLVKARAALQRALGEL